MITNKFTNQNRLITKFPCKTEVMNAIFKEFADRCSFIKTRESGKYSPAPPPKKP